MTPSHEHGVRVERTDVSPVGVTRVGIGVVLVTAVTALAMLGLLNLMLERGRAEDPAPRPLPAGENRRPPEPRLQVQPALDVQALRAEEAELLGSYGWVDERAGIVRIPIERALEIAAERGLPSFAPSPQPPEKKK